jgi:DNA helicase II / ATP-dependent DNA helicase PcrA
MTNKRFQELYFELNEEQKKAVDTVEGTVLVMAGPGTGKTQVLTLRIANILMKTDASPENILALTFTESGAHSMRKRLVEIVGSLAYKVNIYTFHGFCNDVIKKYPEDFPRIVGSTNITDIDQIKIIESIIDDTDLEKIKLSGDRYFYVGPVISSIRHLKRENVGPDRFSELVLKQKNDFWNIEDLHHEKGPHKGKMKGKYKDLENKILKNEDLSAVYEKYQTALADLQFYDYEDMIMEVIKELESNKTLLLRLQEEYQYILADEHQDANNSQNKVLELLSNFHQNPNLFIVGDEKQAIFRFQGASADNFLHFQRLYPDALSISLEESYRSTQTILDAAHSLIMNNYDEGSPAVVSLKSRSGHLEKKVVISESPTPESEFLFLISSIKDKLKAGVLPGEIAVLYRDNKDVFPLVRAIEKTDIPFVIESNRDVLADDDIQKIILLLKAVDDLGNEEKLTSALYVDFLDLNSLDLYKLIFYSRKNRINMYEVMASKKDLHEAKISDPDAVLRISSNLTSWGRAGKNMNLINFFEKFVDESGFLKYILSAEGSLEKMDRFEDFFSEVMKIAMSRREYKLAHLLDHLSVLEKYNILIQTKPGSSHSDGVRLMTAHKSKGREYDHVYIIGAQDGRWGSKKQITHFHLPFTDSGTSSDSRNEDERKLFYVALTRARKEVTITYATEGFHREYKLPSRFIEEIDDEYVHHTTSDQTSLVNLSDRSLKFQPKTRKEVPLTNKAFLQNQLLEQGLSVSALNNYLRCPWNYFFDNLIRVPRMQGGHQMYGLAVHDTLRLYFERYKDEEDLQTAEVLQVFKDRLRKYPLSDVDLYSYRDRGESSLSAYFEAYRGKWIRNIINEYSIAGVYVPFEKEGKEKDNILLKGILDKIEFLGQGNEVNVVDYKTAKARSRNAIEGKTKSSSGDYKRQLVFYKLLLDLYESSKYEMVSGEIDFIEPTGQGSHKKEKFFISGEDVAELKDTIGRVASEIYNLSFWNDRCKDDKCRYCAKSEMLF